MTDDPTPRERPALSFPPGAVRFRWLDADGHETDPEFAGLAQPIIELVPPGGFTVERPWQPSDAQVTARLLGAPGDGHDYVDTGVEVTEGGHWRRTFIRDDVAARLGLTHHGNATTVALDDGHAEVVTGAVYGPPGAASILRPDALDDDRTDPMEDQ